MSIRAEGTDSISNSISAPQAYSNEFMESTRHIMDGNIIGYQWATEQAISAECQSLSQSYGSPITYKKTSDNDINSCEAHNMYIGNDMDNSWDDFRAYNSNINASYDSYTKTLTIFGQGEMYNNDISSPWRQYQNVEHVVIENGITSIAHHAFKDLQALKTIVIPNSVTRIGEYAFERCYQLQNVTLPINMKYIRQSAFKDCEKSSVYYNICVCSTNC